MDSHPPFYTGLFRILLVGLFVYSFSQPPFVRVRFGFSWWGYLFAISLLSLPLLLNVKMIFSSDTVTSTYLVILCMYKYTQTYTYIYIYINTYIYVYMCMGDHNTSSVSPPFILYKSCIIRFSYSSAYPILILPSFLLPANWSSKYSIVQYKILNIVFSQVQ